MAGAFQRYGWWLVGLAVVAFALPGNVRSVMAIRCLLGSNAEQCAPSVPDSPDRLRLALASRAQAPADARQLAENFIFRDSDPITEYWLGTIAWKSGDRDTARAYWRDAGFLQQRVKYLVQTGWKEGLTLDQRAATFKSALELDPSEGAAYTALATVYWGQDWEAAAAALDQAVKYVPQGTAEWYWDAGRRAMIRGDWPAAVAALEQSVRLEPSEWPERFLAQAYRNAGNAAAADALDLRIQERYGA